MAAQLTLRFDQRSCCTQAACTYKFRGLSHLSLLVHFRVQAVVSERLSVRLEPVDLRLQPPTAQEFHDSLQRLFAAGAPTARATEN